MLKSLIFWRLLHIVVDFFLLLLAFSLAYFVRVGWIFSTDFDFITYFFSSLVAVIAWIGFLVFAKYYRIPPRSGKRIIYDYALLLCGGIIASSFLIIVYFFNQELFFSRLINVYIILFGIVFLFSSQWLFRLFLKWQKQQNRYIYQTVIVGANRVAEKLIKAINDNPYAPYKILGVIDPYGLYKTIDGSEILGKLDKINDVIEKKSVNCLIQVDAFEHTINLISLCEEKNIKFQFDPALRGIYEENLRIREIAGQTMISFVKRDFEAKEKRLIYRGVDFLLRQVFDVD